ncbi:MAG TPA: hypothetical protein VLB84_16910 [Bacteroidia bacterium]|nr:hypothetical protein [Bacteroidia bacterium]
MLKEKGGNYIGNITFDKEIIYQELLNFLNTNLIEFPAFLIQNGPTLSTEDEITQLLDTFLTIKVREREIALFIFKNQFGYPGTKRSSDIGVIVQQFSKKDAFFVIEAKRLPTPGHGREKEYVLGNLGGIERFKRAHHGNGLPYGAILGYIQENDTDHWYGTINGWITKLIKTNTDTTIVWNKNDLLQTLKNTKISTYKSTNKRIGQSDIILYHYWISFN